MTYKNTFYLKHASQTAGQWNIFETVKLAVKFHFLSGINYIIWMLYLDVTLLYIFTSLYNNNPYNLV